MTMIDLTDKQQLIKYLQTQGLYTKKKLGQNFLIDRDVLNKIIEAADLDSKDIAIEIGPGLGVLTQELILKAKKVVSVELDDKLASLLKENIRSDNLEIINSDVLKLNLNSVLSNYPKYKVVANIPYYITSKIIKLFLTAEKKPESIIVLVQKEVAERICARPGDMSVLALSVQLYGDPNIIGIVDKTSFFPAPEVDSAILKIDNIGYKKPEIDEKVLFRTIKIGFASRRKTLSNNFAAGFRLNKDKVNDIISSIGIDPGKRAEELSLDEWVKLARAFN